MNLREGSERNRVGELTDTGGHSWYLGQVYSFRHLDLLGFNYWGVCIV